MTAAPPAGEAGRWSAVVEPLAAGWRMVGINALWLLASVPVVTVGPATVALMAMARDDVRGRPRPAFRAFAAYFRENARTGFGLSLLTAGPAIGLVLTWRPGLTGAVAPSAFQQVVMLVGAVASAPLVAHGYALAAHTTQNVRDLYRASLVLAVARPVQTLLALAVVVALALLAWWWPFSVVVAGYLGARAIFTGFQRSFDAVQARGVSCDAAAGSRT